MKKSFNVFLAATVAAGMLQLLPVPAAAVDRAPLLSQQTVAGPFGDIGTASVNPATQPPLAPTADAAVTESSRPSPRAASSLMSQSTLAAACTPADFGSRTGSALVTFVQASTVSCVNTLFSVAGTDAYNVFREAQMITIANAFRNAAPSYPGNNNTSILQLVMFLRAGYYVQDNNPSTVGPYGPTLAAATRGGLDSFVAGSHFMDVNSGHGDVLSEVIILSDSANEQARYISTYKRILNAYNSSYDAYWSMDASVNSVFTPIFRGHWNPTFMSTVTADPSLIDTLNAFARNHMDKLSDESWFYLDSNAGTEMARFLDTVALQAKVRPLAKGLLTLSAISGTTAPLWIGVAGMTDAYDQPQCSYYGTCNLVPRLTAASLPITHNCDAGHTIRAQAMTSSELTVACTSMINQDAYFHSVAGSSPGTPVANDYNTNIRVNVFASSKDYRLYAGWIFDISTNNGGMYLEGDPSVPGNQPNFIAYQNNYDNGFPSRIWNLNHEYTHYLDGRFDTYGDFTAGQVVPDIWWIEGFAEYISYHYRGIPNTRAIPEASKHTYALSTLWQTTYENADANRIYQWGYLATRYMLERHRPDVMNIVARFRTGDFQGAYSYYSSTIGTRYDADFNSWLDTLSTGGPTANFTSVVNGLSATSTDTSTGNVVSRLWNFGDGTSATTTPVTHTYATAGTYMVTLTVTGTSGATSSKTASVSVTGTPECTGTDIRALGKNCKRSNLSAATGNLTYLFIYLPAGVSTLTVTSAGSTGNADLYYNANSWATPSAYTARSTNAGNTESLTVSNPAAGYRYISLYATTAFSGVTVTTTY